ncbi:hypothetical protein SSX86_026249 [Deinandra increscens subsp. villosa]|uniref:Uncharacterized protein n=1 Tax=Deinandra increscens subsp. villosa TaxID=3103831 RepID=A0AAP0GNT2_9ASTR
MAERKVINKFYPREFDPAKIPRRRMPKNHQVRVRTMLSMHIRCTKFNARKEDVIGETYKGSIQIFRFYLKSTYCSAEIALKTDAQNNDYVVESGATRNFELWERDDEETGDAMNLLMENRTRDSKRDLDIESALDELKSMKSRRTRVTVDTMLEALQSSQREEQLEKEDEAVIKSIFRGSKQLVTRIDDNEFDDYNVTKKRKVSQDKPTVDETSKKGDLSGRFIVVKKLNK